MSDLEKKDEEKDRYFPEDIMKIIARVNINEAQLVDTPF